MRDHFLLRCAIRLLLPGRFGAGLAPFPPLPAFLPPGPPRWTKLSVESFVFCFDRRPAPPKPNFLSRAARGSFGLPFGPFARFDGRSAIASSTATSKSSSSPAPPSSAPFRSVEHASQ